MKKTRREISMDELTKKQNGLSNLFNASVHIKINNINKRDFNFFSDSSYSTIAKRFLRYSQMISSHKNRIMVSFTVIDTEFPHNELTLNKKRIGKILKTNYIIHELNGKPCVSIFLIPDRKFL